MVRISKQAEKRRRSPRKYRTPSEKTGSLQQTSQYKAHENGVEGDLASKVFIPKIK